MRNSKFYKDIGFMCGLEIHQRLATKEKLFCACKANLETDESIGEIRRRQRAVAGELGVIDASTQFESSKNRQFVYNTFEKETCLVDVDEEPPHDLNKEALGIALQIAAAFNAKVPDELEPMRKVVVDGSDPSAFQRTILVGYDGYVKVGSKKINVPSIFLEEESSGIEHSDRELVIYNVDRLGIPLVEIDTAPEISTPEEAKEAAKQIGLLLRLTGKVQRGIGTIRQDVNVSIKNGARTEIKGFQDLDSMPQVIDNEVERQLALLKVRDMVAKRKAEVGQAIDISHVFSSTKCGIIRKSLDSNGTVIGFALKGFKGALGYELNPGRRLGSEISEYAKLAGVGGIIHSDENLAQYGISESEIREIEKALKTGANDAFVLVTGPSDVCATAVAYARQRAELAIKQVPKETRGIDSKTLITKFLRPLPGGSRMYPETDIRPIPVNAKEYGILIKKAVNPEIVLKELEKEIENKDLAMQMLWSPLLSTYNEILNKTGVMGSVVAPILLEKYTELRRQGIDTEAITTDAIVAIFEEYKSKTITKAAIEELLKHTPKTKKDVLDAIRSLNLQRITGRRLEELVAKFSDKPKNDTLREIMAKYRLVVDGAELNALLKTMKQ
ncbi:MAG: Glu-tRNA(Gln) amidotransferase subunit GatE [Candidatus Micrarchaeaceae archaeon]